MRIINVGAWEVAAWLRGAAWNMPSDFDVISALSFFHGANSGQPCMIEIAESLAFDGAAVQGGPS